MTIIDRELFLKLPTEDVAKLVRAAGPQVCVFPINGTRRWFRLEHAEKTKDSSIDEYLDIAGKRHIQIYKMCFEHGLDTLLTPVFGSELLTRGEEYMQKIGAAGMARLATHPDFLSFYEEHKVRVRFYGDHRKQLAGTPFDYLCDLFDDISKLTTHNDRYRLFYGVFANDATETIAELSVQYFRKTGNIPLRRELVEQYYGEYVSPATLFIGFDKFSVFDYPLLNLGEEDLYFTVAPSLYLSESTLTKMLYDHIYVRHSGEPDYSAMPQSSWLHMRNFYEQHKEDVFGVGEIRNFFWYPHT